MALSPAAFAVDLSLAVWAKEDAYPKLLVKASNLSEFFAHGLGVLCIVFLVGLLDTKGWRRGMTVLIGAFSAGLTADLMKLLIFRVRPRDFDFAGGILTTFQEWLPVASRQFTHLSSSFPSSHAATAAGLAFVLILLYPKAKPIFTVLLGLSCAQRIVSSAHFLSDVLFGAGLGWCVSCLVVWCLVPSSWWSDQAPASRLGRPAQSDESKGKAT